MSPARRWRPAEIPWKAPTGKEATMVSETHPIARPRPTSSARPSRLVLAAYPLGAIALATIVWAVVVRVFKIKPYIIPAPETVFQTFVDRFGLLSFHALPTLLE